MRNPHGNAVNLWQGLLAAVLGVGIGVLLNNYVMSLRYPQPSPQLAGMIQPNQRKCNSLPLPQIQVIPNLDRPMTLLVMGVDSNGHGTQRFQSTRSDTMILVRLDPTKKRVGVVSIPRDSRVSIPRGHGIDKINSAHAYGGPDLAMETVSENFHVPIDNYVVIDTQGLRKVFELLGPVEVLVEKRMHYTDRAAGLHVALEPGLQKLTAKQAEEYVRFRHDPRGDIGRIERQQWFLRQVTGKLKEPQVWLKLPEMFKIASECVVTNLPGEDMAKIASFAKDVKPNQIESATLPGTAVCIKGGSYWMPDEEASRLVFQRVLGTEGLTIEGDCLAQLPGNSAIAATETTAQPIPPLTICLRYPVTSEETARTVEKTLKHYGYKIKYKYRSDASDCQHEQIIQNSFRADDVMTGKLRDDLPDLENWPVVVSPDSRALTDFTLVLSQHTVAHELPTEMPVEAVNTAPSITNAASQAGTVSNTTTKTDIH